MNKNYSFLENFIIDSLQGMTHAWTLNNCNFHPEKLLFRENKDQIVFECISKNYLSILFEDSCTEKKLEVNINKVPRLMEYLCEKGEFSLQFYIKNNWIDEFSETEEIILNILKNGEPPLKFLDRLDYEDYFALVLKDDGRVLLSIKVENKNLYCLGFQVISCDFFHRNSALEYKKLIPLHKVKDFPYLNNHLNQELLVYNDVEPNIIDFIENVKLMSSDKFSKIALLYSLESEMNKKTIKDKIKKI